MNNKRKDKDPLFAEVNLTGDEFRQSPSNHIQRSGLQGIVSEEFNRYLTQDEAFIFIGKK